MPLADLPLHPPRLRYLRHRPRALPALRHR